MPITQAFWTKGHARSCCSYAGLAALAEGLGFADRERETPFKWRVWSSLLALAHSSHQHAKTGFCSWALGGRELASSLKLNLKLVGSKGNYLKGFTLGACCDL